MEALIARGFIGGAVLFHAFRYHSFREWQHLNTSDESLGWYFSPHYHAVGFFKESYSQCRNCPFFTSWKTNHGCSKAEFCNGFEQLTRRVNAGFTGDDGVAVAGDNCIVKVEGARKTIVGTIYYQLNHSSLRVGHDRFSPLTWVGCCSHKNLDFEAVPEKHTCPICGAELSRIRYVGVAPCDICKNESDPNFHRHLFVDLYDENGCANFAYSDSGGGDTG